MSHWPSEESNRNISAAVHHYWHDYWSAAEVWEGPNAAYEARKK